MATLLSVNVGMPKDVSWRGRTVHTAVWKQPVSGPQMVRRLNIDGDGQGDLGGHGGEIRAVLVYQVESYRHWQEVFERDDLEHGAFGENFTVEGLADDDVCIGDRYRIGTAEFEVTQPRVTCFRVGMRMGEPQLPSLLVAHRRPGFYLRVLTEGHVSAGDEIVRTQQGPHALSVADADALLYLPGHDPDLLRTALDIPALSPGWRGSFQSMLDTESGPTQTGRDRTGTAAGVGGLPHHDRERGHRRERLRDDVPARRGRRASGVPARSVRHHQGDRGRRPGPGADLLALRRPRRRRLPHQREARCARNGQPVSPRASSPRRPDRGGGSTRRLRSRRGHATRCCSSRPASA